MVVNISTAEIYTTMGFHSWRGWNTSLHSARVSYAEEDHQVSIPVLTQLLL